MVWWGMTTPSTDQQVTVLLINGEGGSIELVARRTSDGWSYSVATSESAMLDDDGQPSVVQRPWADWATALVQLGHYPWQRLHPETVHPDFRDRIRDALRDRPLTSADRRRWDRALGVIS
jgi:hypothetical protein